MGALFDAKGWTRRTMAGSESADHAKQRLLEAGVCVDLEGAVRFTAAAECIYTSTPWVQDIPVRNNTLGTATAVAETRVGGWTPGRVPKRMIGRICKHLDAIEAAKLYLDPQQAPDDHDRAYKRQVMLSSGGPFSGSIWTEIPSEREFFDQSHFTMATRRRLAVVQVSEGLTCQLAESAGTSVARPCGEILDYRLTHPCSACAKGPAKNRTHEFLKTSLGNALQACQAQMDFERLVPELCRGDTTKGIATDAIMDIVAAFPNATRQYWIDVTVRSPHAERYNTSAARNAANTVGHAASEGAKEKWQKYKSELVVPIAYEPYGRLAIESIRCLEQIAINAATVDTERWAGSQLLTRWLRTCQRMVIWAASDVALAALGKGATKTEAAIARGNPARRRTEGRTIPPSGSVSATPPGASTQDVSQSTLAERSSTSVFPTMQHTRMQYRSIPPGVR